MDTKQIVNSWRWRIIRVGLTMGDFALSLGLAKSAMSEYVSGKKSPSLGRFEQIENTLAGLERAAGISSGRTD